MFFNKSKSFSRQFTLIVFLAMIGFLPSNLKASFLNNPTNRFVFSVGTELGFIKVLSHKTQFSQDGTPMDFKYGFSFYRLSYQYDFNRSPEKEIAIGLSLQLRNASISFASKDGQLFRINQNLGPVPIIRFRGRLPLNRVSWLGAEIDGFYASGRIITGSRNDFIGAILDGSLRYGVQINESLEGFLNFRYLGGGARGTEENQTGPGDGYTDNWLHTTSITLGFYLK